MFLPKQSMMDELPDPNQSIKTQFELKKKGTVPKNMTSDKKYCNSHY